MYTQNKNNQAGAGEIAQQFRAPTALTEDLGSIPSTHMVAHNLLPSKSPVPGYLIPSSGLYGHQGYMYTCRQNTHTHKNNKINL